MHGTNPIRKPIQGDGTELNIQEIFATLQGEGPFAGWPAVFVRFGGCNLACTFCDTEFERFSPLPLEMILERVEVLATEEGKRLRHLVVITGGEPFLQPLERFCERLLTKGFKVQIETNGTLFRPVPPEVDIVCSPKNTGSGYFPLRADLLARVSALKFIVSAGNPGYGDVGDVGQGEGIPVYVQPMDEYDEAKNKANLAFATELAQRKGYRLSLQLHKILGIA